MSVEEVQMLTRRILVDINALIYTAGHLSELLSEIDFEDLLCMCPERATHVSPGQRPGADMIPKCAL